MDAYATLATALGLLAPRFKTLGGLDGEATDTSTIPTETSTASSTKDVLKLMSRPSSSITSSAQDTNSSNSSRYSFPATAESRKRGVALALKLADLAETLQRPPAEEEALLSFAVE